MWLVAAVLLMASATTVASECLLSYNVARCDGRQMKEVPADLPANITSLYMSNNNLVVLHSNGLQKYTQLDELHLDYCGLERLSAKAFQHLPRLTKLSLSYNKLTRIGNDIFRNNSVLEYLVLSSNKLLITPEEPFLISRSVRDLLVANCGIQQIFGSTFSRLNQLTILGLSYNQLTYIENAIFRNNSALETVELSGNKLLIAPDEPFLISSSIQELHMADCGIQQIYGTTFSELSQLTGLDLSYNQLTYIEIDIFRNNSGLEGVMLSGNKLLITPDEPFLISSSIQTLHMANCGIQQIFGSTFSRLSQLTVLDLFANVIISISADAFDNNKLKRIHVDSVETIRPAKGRICQNWTHEGSLYRASLRELCSEPNTEEAAEETHSPTTSESKESGSPKTSVNEHVSDVTTEEPASTSSSSPLTSLTIAVTSTPGTGVLCAYIAVVLLAGVALVGLGRKYSRRGCLHAILPCPEYEYMAPAYKRLAMPQRQIPLSKSELHVPVTAEVAQTMVPPLPPPRPRSDDSLHYEDVGGSTAASRGQATD